MAVPPLRRRVGKIEIDNKERKIKEELNKRLKNEKKENITPEEHEARIKKLREIGLLK